MSVIKFMNALSAPLGKRVNAMIVNRRLFGFVAATVTAVVLAGASAGDATPRGMVPAHPRPAAMRPASADRSLPVSTQI
jgi:hypothetical protein